MSTLKSTPNVTEGRRSNYGNLDATHTLTLKNLIQAQNAAYYTFIGDLISSSVTRDEAVNKWLEKYEEDGSKKG